MTIELLNMDCMDYMRDQSDNAFELAIVDPPYGIGFDGHSQIIGSSGKSKGFSPKNLYEKKSWDSFTPSADYFLELMRVSESQIIWGGNYFTKHLPPVKGWVYWDKAPNGKNLTFSDGELAWTSLGNPLRAVTIPWIGFGMVNSGEKKIHPTQKPVKLYDWLLANYAKEGDRILDTHLGSGSSAIAAHYGGFDFVGMELDEDYYKTACERFDRETAQQDMF